MFHRFGLLSKVKSFLDSFFLSCWLAESGRSHAFRMKSLMFCFWRNCVFKTKLMPDGEGSNARRQAAGIWCEVLPFDEIASPKQDSSDNRKGGRVSGSLARKQSQGFRKNVSARHACEDQKGKCTVSWWRNGKKSKHSKDWWLLFKTACLQCCMSTIRSKVARRWKVNWNWLSFVNRESCCFFKIRWKQNTNQDWCTLKSERWQIVLN